MNFSEIFGSKLFDDIGWTLLDSLWQGALIAAALYFLLALTKHRPANVRYVLAVAALILAFLAPVATFVMRSQAPAYSSPGAAVELVEHERERNIAVAESNLHPRAIERTKTDDTIGGISTALGNLRQNFPAFLRVVVWVWLAGVMFSALHLVGGLWQIRRYRTNGIVASIEGWEQLFADLCEKLQIKQTVVLLGSTNINVPIAIGFLKPFSKCRHASSRRSSPTS
jgi:hypothetical protein